MIDQDILPALRRAHLFGASALLVLLLASVAWFATYAGPFVTTVAETLRDFPPRQAATLLLGDLAGLLPQMGPVPAIAPLLLLALVGSGLGITVLLVAWLAALRLAFVWMISGLIYLRGDEGFQQVPPDFADPQAIAERSDSTGFTRVPLSIPESLLAGPRGVLLRPCHGPLAKRLLRPASTVLRALVRPLFYMGMTLAVLALLILVLQTGVPDARQALTVAVQMLSHGTIQPLMVWTGAFLAVGAVTAIYDVAFMRALLPRQRHWNDPHVSPDMSLNRMGSFEQFKRQLLTALQGQGRSQVARTYTLRDGQTACDSFSDHSDVRLTLLIEGRNRVIEDHTHQAAGRRVMVGVALVLAAIAVVLFVLPAGIILDLLSGQPILTADILPAVLHVALTAGLAKRLSATGRRFQSEGAKVLDLISHETPVAVVDIVGTVDRSVRRGLDSLGQNAFEQQRQLLSFSASVKAATLSSHSHLISGQREPWASAGDEHSGTLEEWLRHVMMQDTLPEGQTAPSLPHLIGHGPATDTIAQTPEEAASHPSAAMARRMPEGNPSRT